MALAQPNTAQFKSILVVDDDQQFVNLLRDSLTREGYFVYCGFDGHMAINLAEKHQPDLILMDVNMPMMNGFKAFEKLRAREQTARIPVIFVSEMQSQVITPVVDASPRSAHIKKPVDISDLTSLMRQFLAEYAA